jgi:hypothetical protein
MRRLFEPEGVRGQKDGRNCKMTSLIISTLHQILLGVVKIRRMRWVEHVEHQKRRDAWRN